MPSCRRSEREDEGATWEEGREVGYWEAMVASSEGKNSVADGVLYHPGASAFLRSRADLPESLKNQRDVVPPVDWPRVSLESPRFLFIDLETTGLHPARDVIVEIALSFFVLDGNRLHHIQSYVGWEDPGFPISQRVVRIHGLHQSHLTGQSIAWGAVQAFFDQVDFAVGHNVLQFDARFLEGKITFDRWLDTLHYPWRRELKVPSARLASILHALKISSRRAHSALEDALNLALALQSVRGGLTWLTAAFEGLRQKVGDQLEVIRQRALARYEATGKDTYVIGAATPMVVFRVQVGDQRAIHWYSGDGHPVEESFVLRTLWRAYLQTRRTEHLYSWLDG